MEKKRKNQKRPWRFLFGATAILSGGWLLLRAIAPRLLLGLGTLQWNFSSGEAATIGIIGGADGPTAIFVTGAVSSGPDWDEVVMGAVFLVSVLGRFLLCNRK